VASPAQPLAADSLSVLASVQNGSAAANTVTRAQGRTARGGGGVSFAWFAEDELDDLSMLAGTRLLAREPRLTAVSHQALSDGSGGSFWVHCLQRRAPFSATRSRYTTRPHTASTRPNA
jgi:hypothetical protein